MPEIGPADVLIKVARRRSILRHLARPGRLSAQTEVPSCRAWKAPARIEAVGAEVNWQPGDRVIFGVRPGAFANTSGCRPAAT